MTRPPESPYAPPKSPLEQREGPPTWERLATHGQRLANMLVDQVAIQVLGVAAGFVLAVLGRVPRGVTAFAVGAAIAFCYYTVLESSFGRTLGKLVTGTRVIAEDGGEARFGQVLGRSFARMIPFEPFSFRAGPVGWHDSMSGTRVIRIR